MIDPTKDTSFGTVPNDSEDVPNRSERNAETFRTVPNESVSRSEPSEQKNRELEPTAHGAFGNVPNRSERNDNRSERNAESFGTVPNDSEDVRNEKAIVRNDSEDVPNEDRENSKDVPNRSEQITRQSSEQFRTAPACSTTHTELTITVREAARIFEEAGVPRTERAITNWCNQNARGITRLECCYNNEERKYYIAPSSISKVIQEERKKGQYTEYREGSMPVSDDLLNPSEETTHDTRKDTEENIEQTSGRNEVPRAQETTQEKREAHEERSEPHRGGSEARSSERSSEHSSEPRESLGDDERAKLKELQMENFELRVQLEGQKYLVRQFDSLVEGERERHEREKLSLVDRLTDARHQIGSLEQKLLQLEAGKAPVREAHSSDAEENTSEAHIRRMESGERQASGSSAY